MPAFAECHPDVTIILASLLLATIIFFLGNALLSVPVPVVGRFITPPASIHRLFSLFLGASTVSTGSVRPHTFNILHGPLNLSLDLTLGLLDTLLNKLIWFFVDIPSKLLESLL